jgi:hypothetical protein
MALESIIWCQIEQWKFSQIFTDFFHDLSFPDLSISIFVCYTKFLFMICLSRFVFHDLSFHELSWHPEKYFTDL